jgi:hypothetical protein
MFPDINIICFSTTFPGVGLMTVSVIATTHTTFQEDHELKALLWKVLSELRSRVSVLDSVSCPVERLTSGPDDFVVVAEMDTTPSDTDTDLGAVLVQSAAEAGSKHTPAES